MSRCSVSVMILAGSQYRVFQLHKIQPLSPVPVCNSHRLHRREYHHQDSRCNRRNQWWRRTNRHKVHARHRQGTTKLVGYLCPHNRYRLKGKTTMSCTIATLSSIRLKPLDYGSGYKTLWEASECFPPRKLALRSPPENAITVCAVMSRPPLPATQFLNNPLNGVAAFNHTPVRSKLQNNFIVIVIFFAMTSHFYNVTYKYGKIMTLHNYSVELLTGSR